MRILELSCPHCGASLDFHGGKRFSECEYCHHKFVLDDEECAAPADTVEKEDPIFERVNFVITAEKGKKAVALRDELMESEPDSPHTWLLDGYVNLREGDEDGNDKWKSCRSSWQHAIRLLNSDYYLDEYIQLMGIGIGYWVDNDFMDGEKSSKACEFLLDEITDKFDLDYMSEFYHQLYKGIVKHIDVSDFKSYSSELLEDHVLLNSVAFESDYSRLIDKCHEYSEFIKSSIYISNYAMYQYLEKILVRKTKGMTEEDRNRVADYWETHSMDRELQSAWDKMMGAAEYAIELDDELDGEYWEESMSLVEKLKNRNSKLICHQDCCDYYAIYVDKNDNRPLKEIFDEYFEEHPDEAVGDDLKQAVVRYVNQYLCL